MEVVLPAVRLDKSKLLANYIGIGANNLLVLREYTLYYILLRVFISIYFTYFKSDFHFALLFTLSRYFIILIMFYVIPSFIIYSKTKSRAKKTNNTRNLIYYLKYY